MDSDNESYYEESSDSEKGAGPLHINVNVNIDESPKSALAQPESPSPVLPVPIPVGEFSPVWELPDDGTIFLNYFTRTDVLELKTGP